jgi:HK97 family phage prohead protease
MVAVEFERTYDLDSIEIERGGDGRTVTAYAAVFDQDSEIRDQHGHYFERISRSAFNRTLSMRSVDRIGVFYNHGYDLTGKPNMVGSVPIGTPLKVEPDTRGLLTVTRYNRSPLAEQVLEAIKDGQIRGQSFKGRVFQSQDMPAGAGGVKTVLRAEIGLQEYGPTHSPAYDGAGIVAVRSQDELAELIRTMIQQYAGTPLGLARDQATPDQGLGPEDSASSHSRKTAAQRNAMRARALSLGVIHGQAPQVERDRG